MPGQILTLITRAGMLGQRRGLVAVTRSDSQELQGTRPAVRRDSAGVSDGWLVTWPCGGGSLT